MKTYCREPIRYSLIDIHWLAIMWAVHDGDQIGAEKAAEAAVTALTPKELEVLDRKIMAASTHLKPLGTHHG